MEFGGVMGVDGLAGSSRVGRDEGSVGGGSNNNALLAVSTLLSSDAAADSNRQKGLFGSAAASPKQGRTGVATEDWRCPKMARTEAMPVPTEKGHSTHFLRSNTHSLFPEGQQMLSFSSPNQGSLLLCHDGNLPYYLPSTSSMSSTSAAFARNGGLGCGGLLSGIRGPFTPSQWVELEHQAMIYKYIDANAPIPPSLLVSIRKSQSLSGYTGYSAGSLTPSTFGWGSFQLGFSGSSDPEPGRCRRTDGKKWRCSRDAVADQKYCERHMNRGRHRSRKPVEGHGQAKVMPTIAPSSAASAVSVGSSSNVPSPKFNRVLTNNESANNQGHDAQDLSISISMNSTTNQTTVPVPTISKQYNPFEPPSRQADFVASSSDSYLNHSVSSCVENKNTGSTLDLSNQESEPQHLRHFINNWPENHNDRSTVAWPELEQAHSERTQLSISIPMSSPDFSSASPGQEKLTLSSLKSSKVFDPIHMGLGVGSILDNMNQRQGGWGPSVGGPLGEVLNNTNNNPKRCIKNNSPVLNLIDGWDASPQLESSPTGVLQKTYGSHTSSAGSSPRAENYKNQENNGSLCDDLLGSSLVNATSIHSL